MLFNWVLWKYVAMARSIISILLCLAWAVFAPPARAQWVCHVTEDEDIGQGSQWYGTYWYTALSCKGSLAVAAADVVPLVDTVHGYYLAFLISEDGGEAWRITSQGLPAPTWAHRPIITGIDQIDSLHIVAFGDSDLLVRTTDRGANWQELTSPSSHPIGSISFSDSLHGILVALVGLDTTVQGTYVTSDGGLDWSPAPFTRVNDEFCHDYGDGMYRVFRGDNGTVYTTRDDWNTVDSTGPIITDINARYYLFQGCSFGGGDTMFAYGYRKYPAVGIYPYVGWTTNGGEQWTTAYDGDTTSHRYAGEAYAISDIDRDTIVAGLDGANQNTMLWSSDHGNSWRPDTLLMPSNYLEFYNFGVGFNSAGEMLGAYSLGGIGPADGPFLLAARRATASVRAQRVGSDNMELFPDPAVNSTTVTGEAPGRTLHFLNILGRDVLDATVPATGTLALDVSQLPRGMYMVMVEEHGTMVPAGRVVLN